MSNKINLCLQPEKRLCLSLAVPVVPLVANTPPHVAQFRRDFPAVARCLDSMREKAIAARSDGAEA